MPFARLRPVYPEPSWTFRGLDPFKKTRDEMMRRMRAALGQSTFSRRAKVAFSKALTIHVQGMTMTVVVNHPGWAPLVEGRKRKQMTWLTKSKSPIPIVTDEGEVIFRSANPKTMSNGKWVHPGRDPAGFVDKAKLAVSRYVRESLAKQLVAQIKASLRR